MSAPIEILLVEDNAGDVQLVRRALRELQIPLHLRTVSDGVEAMTLLHREGAYAEAQRPDLILLDLNLPRKDGREVLAEIKQDDALQAIPVVVLSSSQAPHDVVCAYQLHANCYVTKPMDLEQFLGTLRAIVQFWCGMVKLPDGRH